MSNVERVAAAIEAATPATDLSSPGEISAGQLVTSVGDIESAVPLSSDSAIVVTRPTAEGEQAARIELPDEVSVGDGVVANDGTVVYAANDDSGDAVAVQTLADGSTRIQTVIGTADSAHEFGYQMDGYHPYQSDTGEVVFVDDSGNVVPVGAPWARDVSGQPVQTGYEIRGDELFQVVTPDASTVYPVVADPTWMWAGPAWGMKLTRAETSRVRDYAAALGMCATFTNKLPKVAIACAVFGSYIVAQANIAQGDSPKTCLFFTAAPIPGVIWRLPC
ncbi:hypothetical protein [Microbacterium natoriense]|uniref:hypothetical protein n=1 Tax=Microbacterium natoriense TaxID=284570 RepID=UPI0027D8E6F9|nr:hypothetical protein [Microbacterium natoriense]